MVKLYFNQETGPKNLRNSSSILWSYPTYFLAQTQEKNSSPKKIPYISGNGNSRKASYISGNGTFQSTPRKFLILQERKPRKNLLCFLKRKLFLYFRKWKTGKNSICFGKRNFLIFKETLKNFSRPKSKKKIFIFQQVTCKAKFSKSKYFFIIII